MAGLSDGLYQKKKTNQQHIETFHQHTGIKTPSSIRGYQNQLQWPPHSLPRHLFLPFKKRPITKPRCRSRQYNHLYNNKTPLRNTFSPIHIDHLYAEPSLMPARHCHAHAETSSRRKEVAVEKVVPRKKRTARESSVYSIEDAWREVVARSPQLRSVDERAEEFIYKFREEIKLQKDKSVFEFEERLARIA